LYIKEIFSGLNPANKPSITLFDNEYQYRDMLVEKNITVYSYCEHHFVPIIGKAHVGYIHRKKGNRTLQIVQARSHERLTEQIACSLRENLAVSDEAIVIEATHLCVASRGIQDVNSSTVTSHFSGKFGGCHATQLPRLS